MSNPLALVIEDDAAVADAYIEALREAGFETEVALNGNAGLARLAATTPDLVVLDMRLPFVSGTEILRQIRANERLKQTRVIITTGDSQMAAALEDE
ncbi:MAG: response regulator, partial [Anaerolineales bacterium]